MAPADMPGTAANVILALCGSTIATYFASVCFRKKKFSIADIANAALAGGVAIGSTCDEVGPTAAFVIGVLAGVLSTFGFAAIQPSLERLLGKTDTCGVLHLHGLPGLLGGIVAIFAVKDISAISQTKGIVLTIAVALITGFVAGKMLSLLGRHSEPYTDCEMDA